VQRHRVLRAQRPQLAVERAQQRRRRSVRPTRRLPAHAHGLGRLRHAPLLPKARQHASPRAATQSRLAKHKQSASLPRPRRRRRIRKLNQ